MSQWKILWRIISKVGTYIPAVQVTILCMPRLEDNFVEVLFAADYATGLGNLFLTAKLVII